MNRRIMVLLAAFMLTGTQVHAGNGDLVVNGNAGIGTTAPGAKLDVRYKDSNTNLYRASDSSGLYRWRVDQFFNMVMTNSTGQDTMTIFNNGNIGIGTSSPNTKLHITNNDYPYLYLGGPEANSGMGLFVTIDQAHGWARSEIGQGYKPTTSGWQVTGNYGYNGIRFDNGGISFVAGNEGAGSTAVQKPMWVGQNGYIGLGTIAPSSKLAIYDTSSFNPANTSLNTINLGHVISVNGWNATGICSGNSTSGNPACLAANGGNWYFGFQADANNMNSTAYLTNTGNLYLLGNIIPYGFASDVTIKKDIVTITDTINKIKTLRGVYYKLKDEKQEQDRQVGVIAQELETSFPELVIISDNPLCMNQTTDCERPKIKTVDYPKLSAVALQGVKELSDKVDDLEKRLAKLEQLVVK